jgi:hypothetical protein
MLPTAGMVMAVTDLGRDFTVEAGGVMDGAVTDGVAMDGEDVVGVEAEIMPRNHAPRSSNDGQQPALLKSTPALYLVFGK